MYGLPWCIPPANKFNAEYSTALCPAARPSLARVGASGCDLAKDSGPCSSSQGETLKAEAELEPFVRLIEALEPWLEELVLIGGWAHRLYRLAPRAQGLGYPPLTTLDSDISVPSKIEAKETSIRDCLLAA